MSTTLEIASDSIPQAIDVLSDKRLGIQVNVDIQRIIKTLVAIVISLIIVGTSADIIIHHVAPSTDHAIARGLRRLDINSEPSIPNWYSSFALVACSILLSVITFAKIQAKDRFSKQWMILAMLFFGLSLDEGVRLHEMIHTVMIRLVDAQGVLYFPWVMPALIFVGVVGVFYLPFLIHIDRRTAVLFIVAGGIYVFGAVGMDMIGGLLVEKHGMESIQHSFAQTFEELFEMLGVVVFIYALLDYIRRNVGPVQLRVA